MCVCMRACNALIMNLIHWGRSLGHWRDNLYVKRGAVGGAAARIAGDAVPGKRHFDEALHRTSWTVDEKVGGAQGAWRCRRRQVAKSTNVQRTQFSQCTNMRRGSRPNGERCTPPIAPSLTQTSIHRSPVAFAI